jgi:tRNA(Ser,Leu) C12 N-acetylase TAN1
LQEAVTPFLDRIPGGTFFFRLERRGMLGQIMSQEIERAVAEHLYAQAERQGKTLHTDFDNPDYIIAAETVRDECGVALLARDMRERYPFVQTR